MPNPPSKTLVNPDELFGCRNIRFHDRHDSQHPQLLRLCANFNFSVLQLQYKIFSHLTRKMVPSEFAFVLAIQDELTHYWYSVTPRFSDLKMLDDYTRRHEIDILHMHLFGDEDEDYNHFKESGFY